MTFEEWWKLSGQAQIRALSQLPARSYADIEATLRCAALSGWRGAETGNQTPFDAWQELHSSECREQRYNETCFRLCWNSAICEALGEIKKRRELDPNPNASELMLIIERLKTIP